MLQKIHRFSNADVGLGYLAGRQFLFLFLLSLSLPLYLMNEKEPAPPLPTTKTSDDTNGDNLADMVDKASSELADRYKVERIATPLVTTKAWTATKNTFFLTFFFFRHRSITYNNNAISVAIKSRTQDEQQPR
jgi:hypothetical protein